MTDILAAGTAKKKIYGHSSSRNSVSVSTPEAVGFLRRKTWDIFEHVGYIVGSKDVVPFPLVSLHWEAMMYVNVDLRLINTWTNAHLEQQDVR